MGSRRDRGRGRDIASERIEILMGQAAEAASGGDLETADRRVTQAKAISLRCNARIPREYGTRFCPKCSGYYSSQTLKCRLDPVRHRVRMSCLRCGHAAYRPYAREKRMRKAA
jgi:RNase P subunit RPR2